MHKQLCVLGLGNLMRTDDAIGMLAVQELACSGLQKEIIFVEGGTLGLDLMHPLRGITHLLALDAVDIGANPGTLVRFEKKNLGEIPAGKSAHLLGFSDLLGVLKLIGEEPEEIVLLGVQPDSTTWGTELTNTAQLAFPRLVASAREQVKAWIAQETTPGSPHEVSIQAHA